jgi:antitoxin component of MazEF toxin-antitoxin module
MTVCRFSATLLAADGGNATGIVVPPEVIEALGRGKRPPVRVSLNGHSFRTTIGIMSGDHMIPVSAAVCTAAGLAAGDAVAVELEVDTSPREIEIPPDLAVGLDANRTAKDFFATLSNSLQRYHIDNINAAKAADTRQRRIDKSIELFLAGKPR